MKKTLLAIASCLVMLNMTPAKANTCLEFRSAAFFPMGCDFRKIYGNVGVDYELEFSTDICCSCFDFWANLTWYPNHGHIGNSCGSTDVNILNGSFGLRASCSVCDCFCLYGGLGPILGGVWVDNKRKCCSTTDCSSKKNKDSAFAVGGIVKAGILYYFTCNLFLDLFVDYFYEPAFFHRTVDIGGFRTGLGLGVCF